MGQEIPEGGFTEAHRALFRDRLREETKLLKGWFDERRFLYAETPTLGLEMEGWLVDEELRPAPCNEAFLAALDDPLVVPELAQYNFEINAPPGPAGGGGLGQLRGHVERLWGAARQAAVGLGVAPVMIGMLPTVREEMLRPEWMTPSNRYRALNEEVLRLRSGRNMAIRIAGADELRLTMDNVMLEAACTSLQVHLQTNQEDAKRVYNAALVLAAPLVAVAANAPFLCGRSLWADTRIPTFEQAAACFSYHDVHGAQIGRVTLGGGYVRHSMLELFLENLDGHPVLLPALSDAPPEALAHARLQNGTVWRWVRPVLGLDEAGAAHLRIEHRVMSAGPTVDDVIANVALCVGLAHFYARREAPPEEEIPFEVCKANFYAAARDGLAARVRWTDGEGDLQALLVERLIPEAREGLKALGVETAEIVRAVDQTLEPRVLSGRTGAEWQRDFVDVNGPDPHRLVERYVQLQQSGRPVHRWDA